MRSRVLALLMLALTAVPSWADDPLTQASEAYRRGELSKAAQLFATAADAETNRAQRAEIRVKLAWTYFAMKNRSKAEEALSAALDDSPNLELVRDYYTDDFLALFNRVRTKRAGGPTQSGKSGSSRQPTPPPNTLNALRQRLAAAPDTPTVEAILTDVQSLEGTTPPNALPDVLELKVEVLDRLGRTSEALELKGRIAGMRAAAQAMPGTSAAPLETLLDARRMLASGKAADAASLLRGVLQAQPSCVPAIEILGEALAEAGQLDEAADALHLAMMSGEKPDLLLIMGEVELKRKHVASARTAFRRLVELDFGNDRGWAALGLLAAAAGDIASAREALDRALRLNGTLVEASVVRAQIALQDGTPPLALQLLQRALQVKADDPWALGWMGFAQLAAGNAAGAVDSLKTAVAGGQAQFTLPLAEAERRTGKTADALAVLDQAKSDDPAAGLLRARCLLDSGSTAEADTSLRALLTADPNNAQLHYLLGYTLHTEKQWAAAAAELDKASKLPGAPPQATRGKATSEAANAAAALMDSAVVPPPPAPPK
jgi:tetratricopeptide (TPR) repeat protein